MPTDFEKRCNVIARHAKDRTDVAERDRRIPDDSIRELKEAGFFRAFTPYRYGGDEVQLLPIFEGLIQIAQGCASTAWVAGLVSIHNFFFRLFEQRAQDELWANGPDLLVGSSVAPAGSARRLPGGYGVRGRWPFVSGIDHCSWALITAKVSSDHDDPKSHIFLVPSSDYSICDDWHVAGLRATGSKSIEIREELFVPEHRARLFHLNAPKPEQQNACWQDYVSWEALFRLAFVPPAIGNALAMLAAYREHIATRRAPYTGICFADKQSSLVRLAYSSADIDAARLVLRRDLEEIDQLARSSRSFPQTSVGRIFFDVAYILDRCNQAVDRLFLGSGGKALYEQSPLQRCFQDMHAIRQHAAADVDLAGELFGRLIIVSGDQSAIR